VTWRIAGSYLESCNCEAICPCRRIDGVMGGRSTYGVCLGALSWRILEGHADGVDLSGLGVVLATSYSDDEEGSPWSFVIYLDERADEPQREALEAIFTGHSPGSQVEHFPWAWKESRLLGVRQAEIDRARSGPRLVPGRPLRLRADRPAFPGGARRHLRDPGPRSEVVAESLEVGDEELEFAFRGNCGYESEFEYQG
jgi:Protein of unknown function (DUF1326)